MSFERLSLNRLSLNTATTKKWTLAEAVEGCVRAGIPAIGPWRDRGHEAGLDKAARMIREAGLRVSSLRRGGFLTAPDAEGQAAALADNFEAVREAVARETRELFLVVGGLAPGEKDVVAARQRVADRLEGLVPFAVDHGVRLVLEPLHPLYAADRAPISTLGQGAPDRGKENRSCLHRNRLLGHRNCQRDPPTRQTARGWQCAGIRTTRGSRFTPQTKKLPPPTVWV
ncbi:sugar phosphate isomerase/epimerase [Arthrobacter sp. M4]|uniref:sugar phosphate isomerase/epimerase family protein n=1 Tax=Arthrobacter sp. M4 TaxID=218160 RepID=UPI001CDB8F09|nr:TIM barrel protein [Arthrobacter sp. M4]MCA4131879.1 sugar phosphate isomerase/epimerase [Arthrobacter sp. M4]